MVVTKQTSEDFDRISSLARGTSGRDLLRFVGTLDDESAREMREAIEEGCGQVETDDPPGFENPD
ncbi:MAG TPA: hypothetical protein VEP28_14030 [Rubrobacter sp.]|nr:hypothetical protein [Rubrobacter sp.]